MTFKRFRPFLAVGLITLIVFLVLRSLDLNEVWAILQAARWGFLIPSTTLNVLTVGLIVYRWQNLLEFRAPFWECLAANQIGAYLNMLLPMRLGDVSRSYLIRQHVPHLSVVAILASIGAELTFDMLVLMLLLAVLLMVLPLPALLTSAGALLAVVTVIAVLGILSLSRADWFLEKVLRPLATRLLPQGVAEFGLRQVEKMQAGLSALKNNRQVLVILGITVAGFAVQVVSNWLLLWMFLESVPVYLGLVALVGAGLGLALPLLPAAAGTYELAISLALVSAGVDAEVAAIFALILRAQQAAITIVLGSGFLLREGLTLHDLQAAVLD